MDLVMPRLDGVGAMRQLRERSPQIRVIVLTSFLDDDRLLPAIQAGAAGYLLKDVEPTELAQAVRTASAGQAMLNPAVAARLVEAIAENRAPGVQAERLTRREQEVLEQIAHGRSNKRIALELGISEKTVKAHVGRVLAKLGVADRTQAALLAVREGLVGGRPKTNYHFKAGPGRAYHRPCHFRSSRAHREVSGLRSRTRSPSAGGRWCSTRAVPRI